MKTICTHLLCELSGCDRHKIADYAFVKKSLETAALAANVTILNGYFHQFSPSGVSGVLCLAESHISVHTWPETGYAAVDVFTCGDHAMPQKAVASLSEAFAAEDAYVKNMSRGIPDDGGRHVSMEVPAPQIVAAAKRESTRMRRRKVVPTVK